MDKVVVEVNNLTKKFGSFTAVDDISFEIKEGEIVGLLGPNGAGKTTTIQMLLGLITPTGGRIEIFGKDLRKSREEILSLSNFSSTYTHLPWRLTVWENLYVAALLYDVEKPKEKVKKVIGMMDLEEFENTTIDKLSSGWITHVNLARTFINDPKLILLDEPTASLDPEGAFEIRREILSYRKTNNTTILWTSHNMAEVEEVCDRVIFLKEGKIIATDTPTGLSKTIRFCRISMMVEKGLEKLTKLVEEEEWKIVSKDRFITIEIREEEIPGFLNTLSQEEVQYSEISIDKPTLEDFFITMAKSEEKT